MRKVGRSKLILLFLLSQFYLFGCTNSTPQIKSLDLQTNDLTVYQSDKEATLLISDTTGTVRFDLQCASGMSSLNWSLSSEGPWTEVVKLNNCTEKIPVTLNTGSTANSEIYLRTSGTWGSSIAKKFGIQVTQAVTIPTLIAPDSRWYKLTDTLVFKLNFSEPITVTGTPLLQIQSCSNSDCSLLDSTQWDAIYSSGTGTQQLEFSLNIGSSMVATQGIKISGLLLANGSAITTSNSLSSVDLTLPTFGAIASNVKIDGVVPILSSVNIDSGNSFTRSSNLLLTFSGATDGTGTGSGLNKIWINETGCSSTQWLETSVASSMTFTSSATGDGIRTLYAQVQDLAGNYSNCVSDSIIYDGTAPVITSFSINSGQSYTSNTSLTLDLIASDASSGLSAFLIEPGNCSLSSPTSGTWITNMVSPVNTLFSVDSTNNLKTLQVWVKDEIGNQSCATNTITLDTIPPLLTLSTNPSSGVSPINVSALNISSFALSDIVDSYTYCWVEKDYPSVSPTQFECTSGWQGPSALTIPPASLSLNFQGIKDIYLLVRDHLNNLTVSSAITINRDSIVPTLSNLTQLTPANSKSSVKRPSFRVSGNFTTGDTVQIYLGDQCSLLSPDGISLYGTGVVSVSSSTTVDIVFDHDLPEGTHTFSALVYDGVPNSSCHYYNSLTYEVDFTAPLVSSADIVGTSEWSRLGQTLTASVTLSELCSFAGVTSIKVPFLIGGNSVEANCVVPSVDSNSITCTYTVSVESDTDGVSIPLATSLNVTGSITDLAGNALNAQLATHIYTGTKVDGIAPDVSLISYDDGINSTSLTESPPIQWSGATDADSGILSYKLQLWNDSGVKISETNYSSAPSQPITITGLTLSDFVDGSHSYRTYTTKLIVIDNAGNQSVVDGNGWNVLQWTELSALVSSTSNSGFGQVMALSEDGLRLLVSRKNLSEVKIYRFDGTTAGWVNDQTLTSAESNFGAALDIKVLSGEGYLYAIGAPGDGSTVPGLVRIYKETVTSPTTSSISTLPTLTNPMWVDLIDGNQDDLFGFTVKFVGDFLSIGSPGADGLASTDVNLNYGALFTYQWNSTLGFNTAPLQYQGPSASAEVGRLLAATISDTGQPTLYTFRNGENLIKFSYDSVGNVWSAPAVGTLCSSTCTIADIDAEGAMVAITDGINLYTSFDGATNFSSQTSHVNRLKLITDPEANSAENIGSYLLLDTNNIDGTKTVKSYKAVSGSFLFKQLLFTYTNRGNAAMTGRGHQIFIGDTGVSSSERVLSFK